MSKKVINFPTHGGVQHQEIFGDHITLIAKTMCEMTGVDPEEDQGKWLAWQECLGDLLIALDAAYECGYELKKVVRP